MNLMRHLQDLLYLHECVTVPGFGSFLVQTEKIRVDAEKGNFYPPKRSISFNRLIQQNDGLLAKYVAERENRSYSSTLLSIESEVAVWNRRLKENVLVLPAIGELSLTIENKLLFRPFGKINFDLTATGLQSFQRKPLHAHLQAAAVVPPVTPNSPNENPNKMENNKEPLSFTPEKEESKSPLMKNIIIGIVAVAVLGASYYFGNQYIESEREKSTALAEKQIAKKAESTTYDLGVATPIAVDVVAEVEPVSEETSSVAIQEGSFYSVIAGSFREQSNAEKKLDQLKSEGFEAAFAEQSADGLIRVAYGRYTSKREAYQMLTFITGSLGEEAWYLVEGN